MVNDYIPLKKLTTNEIKYKFKPWITLGLRTSMKRRDKIYKKYIKAKNSDIKDEYEKQYKSLRNQIVTLCRESKRLTSFVLLIISKILGKVLIKL